MRPADLWRHSAFRFALGVSLFVLSTLMLASGIGYGLMKSQLSARQDARVTEIFAAIQETILQGDETDMIEAIETRIKASTERATAYRLRDPIGRVLASNIGDVALPEGWSTAPAADLGIATDASYRLYSGQAGRYSLTVGLTNADIVDLRTDVARAFGWAALAALVAAIVVGTVLALKMQARITEVEVAAARVAQGDLSARLPITADGDDLDQISQAVNAALERLASLVEAMRHASTDIAHDLRTPLNRQRIHIEDAQRKAASGESPKDELAAALAQCETIDQTFAALLRIAQIESGARREKFASLDLAALVADVAEIYADVAVDSGMSLSQDTRGPAWVMGDRELLTQGFANLIENAVRHCPAGSAICCTVQVEGDQVTASFSDNGPGIPAAERDKVLRRLYRLEKSRSSEGTGLGLALVKAVADLHGAELTLTDATPGLCVNMRFARTKGPA
jgi:signal transduction histidine kinase